MCAQRKAGMHVLSCWNGSLCACGWMRDVEAQMQIARERELESTAALDRSRLGEKRREEKAAFATEDENAEYKPCWATRRVFFQRATKGWLAGRCWFA